MYETSDKKLFLVKSSESADKTSISVSQIILAPSFKSELIQLSSLHYPHRPYRFCCYRKSALGTRKPCY